jgi:hypothetical protein
VNLWIFGPGKAEQINLQRKILKQQKNWRLDGELIHNPDDDKTRYATLQKGDFAIIEFSGDATPRSARMYLVAQSLTDHRALHKALEEQYSDAFSSRKGMECIDPDELAVLIESLNLDDDHPVLDLIDADALEDAVQGGFEGVRELRKRRKGRGVARDEFEKARCSAEQNGRLGEELLNSWLEARLRDGSIPGFHWDSNDNAVSPFDFSIVNAEDTSRKLDAKSTTGDFRNRIHISFAELNEMVDSSMPYDIYRLYSVRQDSARMRIAIDIREFARTVLDSLGAQIGRAHV